MATSSSSKKANTGPGYYDLIKEAVIALKERQGSSRHAIDKYVAEKKGSGYQKARLNMALKKGVETGKLVAVKGSFKLAADEKKSASKKPAAGAASKAGVKKASVTKKVVKSSKKVSAKKPTTTKKKVVKKSAAKKPVAKKA
ncbi:hypothetical protein PybrP1_004792 [[Pythium] brassicae (nom. inval.)]|nr:hypothetical protein PybrP1_004792 [[Pythium] brassicae (nom. inval.)]